MPHTAQGLLGTLCAAGFSVVTTAQQTPPAGDPPARQPAPPTTVAAPKPQEPATPAPRSAPLVVTATRGEQDPFTAPFQIDVVDQRQIQQRGYRTTPQALRELPSVMVQETAPGQGSPFVRGFTGFNNLMLLDGVRLNNSVFRSGPNQYWNTVDPLSIARIEVLKGPAGAQYGSDAVGGTVQVFTKSPWATAERGTAYGASSYLRYSNAEDSLFGRGEVSVGQSWDDGSWTGVLLGGDAKSFGDLTGGSSTGIQDYTGYRETAFDLKVEHWTDKDTKWVFLHQQVAQGDVPRTHATIFGKSFAGSAVGTDRLRELDQNRYLTYLQYHKTGLSGPIEAVRANLSWHQQDELEDRTTNTGAQTQNSFRVGTLGAWLQFESDAGSLGRLTYGVDYYRDQVDSKLRRFPTPQASDFIQGPVADDANYDLLGVFVQDALPVGDRAELLLGGRYTFAAAEADRVRDPSTTALIDLHDDWDQFTGSARLRVDLDERHWNVYTGVSQGFRAPNLSDLTSFGTARSGEAEIPTPGLSPEHYLAYEVGTKVRTDDVNASLAWYYTDIDDQIARFPTGTTNGAGQSVITKANVGNGYVQGIEFAGGWRVFEQTSVFGAATWQYGRVTNFETAGSALAKEYTSRLMPVTTMVGVRWERENGCYAEVLAMRAEDADKLSFGDTRDTQRIPPGGTPGYTIANLHGGWRVDERTTIDVGIDNLTDVDYRVHGSGSNSAGRNFWVGMAMRF